MVGMIAAQSIGEPTTQMTLNTFHFAGVSSKSAVTRGVARIEELLSLTENPKNPSLTIALRESDKFDREKSIRIMNQIEHTKLSEVIKNIKICFDPDDKKTLIDEDKETIDQFNEFETLINECNNTEVDEKDKSKWIVRFELDEEIMFNKNITMDDIDE